MVENRGAYMEDKTIVIASNNKHKIEEFQEILKEYKVISLKDIGFVQEIEENGSSFNQNAFIKAIVVHEYLKTKNLEYIVIADDSGICADALNGEPGIYSARYSGEHGNDKANRDKLIKELENKNKDAYFMCVIVAIKPNGESQTFEGKTEGKIIDEERGKTDFGYDCIFYSKELNKTFGEATEDEKNRVSHRGRAIEKLVEWL